jgi:hypothetical protein
MSSHIKRGRQALVIRSRAQSDDSELLNERQQRLMGALQQAVQAEGDMVIHTGDGEKPEYIVEVTQPD